MSVLPNPNGLRFDPTRQRDHVESYFLKANDPSKSRALWIKATVFSRAARDPLAEGWAIAFDRTSGKAHHVAVKHMLPFDGSFFKNDRLDVHWNRDKSESVHLVPTETRGNVQSEGHAISWNLALEGELAPVVPFPFASMYEGAFPRSKLVTPYPLLLASGEVFVDGERWDISNWVGMQGHNWGRGHADLYAWSQINVWEQKEDLTFEGLSGKVRLGPIMTPLVTILCVRHRGVVYDFNQPASVWAARGEVGMNKWSFAAKMRFATIEGEVETNADDMVGLSYQNPRGPVTFCLNSKLARARVRFEARGRAPLLLTSNAAALEIGTHDKTHGVRMYT